jgi:DNA-binding beta-propeller fold protein YncE
VRKLFVGILLVTAFAAAVIAQLETPPEFLMAWGAFGSAPGSLNTPFGLAMDASGNLYVADRLNHRIQKFDRDGVFLASWGSFGMAAGQFREPVDVTVDGDGVIYVTEAVGHRVQKLSATGQPLAMWGVQGAANGQFNSPAGIAVDATNTLFVADQANNRIQKFTSDGQFLGKWGTFGSLDGQLNFPIDVAVDPSGVVYVAEFGGSRVSRFDTNGLFLGKWGSFGAGNGQFSQVLGLGLDSLGNVYVSDRFNHRVQKFDAVGLFLTKWGSQGINDGQFQQPAGIAVSPAGAVYVVDRFNHRVQKFGRRDRPPVANAGADQVLECASPSGAPVTLDGSASSDPDGQALSSFTWSEGGTVLGTGVTLSTTLPLGAHVITLQVVDATGLSSTDDVAVIVGDTTPPTASAAATPNQLWPPNYQMVPVALGVVAADACDPSPRCRIEGITMSDPAGKNGPDWQITGDLAAALRAAKSASNGDRIYTIQLGCTDAAGLWSPATATVRVPKSQGK